MSEMNRPDFVTEAMLMYLDSLRESGIANMYGAVPNIRGQFPGLTTPQSIALLVYWMETFSRRHA